jgi:hypothetical protein
MQQFVFAHGIHFPHSFQLLISPLPKKQTSPPTSVNETTEIWQSYTCMHSNHVEIIWIAV